MLSCAAFASALALRLCDPMLPALAAEFQISLGRAALVVTAAGVAYGCCQLLFGPLGDRHGKFRVLAWACLASTIGAAGSALSDSFATLALARVCTGATTAALIPLSMAWIGDNVGVRERQATLARFLSGQVIGLLSGQVLGGFFADHFGWRWGFAVLAAIYLAVGLLLLRAMARRPHLGRSGESAGGRSRLRAVLALPAARFVVTAVYFEAVAVFGALAFAPAFLHHRFGLSLFHSGLAVGTFGLGGLSYTLLAPWWVRRLGPRRLAQSGSLLLALAFVTLVVAPVWPLGMAACALAGLGFYQLHNTLQTLATQMAPAARGTAVSLFASFFFIGQASGAALSGVLVDHVGAAALFWLAALPLPLVGAAVARHLRTGSPG
ncbi:MAG: MFS transporter [Pseudomonadota bacterium]|nr:MFS transporter [Pseudomonadota bacterium]